MLGDNKGLSYGAVDIEEGTYDEEELVVDDTDDLYAQIPEVDDGETLSSVAESSPYFAEPEDDRVGSSLEWVELLLLLRKYFHLKFKLNCAKIYCNKQFVEVWTRKKPSQKWTIRIQRCLGTSKLMLLDSGHKSTNLWQKYKTKKITFLEKGDLDFSTVF